MTFAVAPPPVSFCTLLLVLFVALALGVKNKPVNTPVSNHEQPHSSYAASIDPSQKFLPRSQFLQTEFETKYNGDKAKTAATNELECQIRTLAYAFAQQIQPFRGTQMATRDALNIDYYCNTNAHTDTDTNPAADRTRYRANDAIRDADGMYTVYVDAVHGSDHSLNGSLSTPFQSIYKALSYLRSFESNAAFKQIVLRAGTLYMNATVDLSPATFDSNLLIRGYPGENVTVSGGIPIDVASVQWQRYDDGHLSTHNIWRTADVNRNAFQLFNDSILSLFTLEPHTRVVRARYPDGHPEVWNNGAYFLNPYWVNTWWLPPNGTQFEPTQVFHDLQNCSLPIETNPCQNKSGDKQFDTYTAGYSKLCDLWTPSYSYWCGQNCGGGWGNEDRRMATEGMRQLPVGMSYNTTLLPEIHAFGDISSAVFHIHHSQGWNVFMYETGDQSLINTAVGNISLGGGGWQGGRVWTKTHDLNQNAVTNLPIMAGKWYMENVLAMLDAENEFYFDKAQQMLYYWQNNSMPGEKPSIDLVIGNLSVLFNLQSDSHLNPLMNVSFMDIEFRDLRYTYMDKWGTPSGGDWALYDSGAFRFENTSNCSIKSSTFVRLDGNCIALSGYNRYSLFENNLFEYIGDNVIGSWGVTDDYDGTAGLQPRMTTAIGNMVHDIGLYQLQSSLWFQAKSCQNIVRNNIVFNVPRAAILFNDAFGGSNSISDNLIFNSCTESGDHGPINSWNRVPFLTNVAHGYPSFDAGYTDITRNFIFANYGGSQGFDTDDGTAWYNEHSNVLYDAMGYKNDYGGFNVNFYNNMNIALRGNAYNCWEIGPINANGPGNEMYDNKCIVYECSANDPNCDVVMAVWPSNLTPNGLKQYNNAFYTPHGNASIQTWNNSGQIYITPQEMYTRYGLSQNSTQNLVPSIDQIISWAKQLLHMHMSSL